MNELQSITTQADKFEKGKFVNEAMSNNVSNFIPDILAKNITKNYKNANKIYGDKLLRYITGYSSEYLERNIKIPEFQKEIAKKINDKVDELKKEKILDKEFKITRYGKELSVATNLFLQLKRIDEFLRFDINGKYEHLYKTDLHGGEKEDIRNYKKGDSYKDIALKSCVKNAIRRNHKSLEVIDLKTFDKKTKANATMILAIDSSSSMKGNKLDAARKAGISLAYKTIMDNNKLGLIDFSDKVNNFIITTNFEESANFIYGINANAQTDLSSTIIHSINMFPHDSDIKHLIILNDIQATKTGLDETTPEDAALNATAIAKANNISISLIIIQQDHNEEIMKFASKIIEISEGKIYKIQNLENLDSLIIQDYEELV